MFKKSLLAAAGVAVIAASGAAYADTTVITKTNSDEKAANATTGLAAGAATGAVVGGPVGAVVGAAIGAWGGNTLTPDQKEVVTYAQAHPVQTVTIPGDVRTGVVVPSDVTLHPVPQHQEYAYVYTNNEPVIVNRQDRKIVRIID